MCPLCQDSRHTLSQCRKWIMTRAARAWTVPAVSLDTAPIPCELSGTPQDTDGLNLGQNSQPSGNDVRDS